MYEEPKHATKKIGFGSATEQLNQEERAQESIVEPYTTFKFSHKSDEYATCVKDC